MSEIVNLRRVKKLKAREDKAGRAEANRIAHGTPKAERALAAARARKEGGHIDAHRLDKKS